MNISTPQIKELATAVRAGLVPLFRPAPMTPVEWADENFYLSSESSYQEGRWETLPFQVAILNSQLTAAMKLIPADVLESVKGDENAED